MDDIPIGRTIPDGELFSISSDTFRQHLYLIGKTGTGKSTMLESMMLADIRAGRPFCLIDPHGTLADKIADAVGEIDPKTGQDRVNETILFNPLSEGAPPVYNPFRGAEDIEDATLADHISAALEHIFHDAWGNRMEDCLKNAMRLAIENNLSLADIPRILIDDDFRASLTCTNLAVADYWHHEYAEYTDSFRDQVISPILNKLRAFDTNPLLKRVVDGETTLDISAIMGNPVQRANGTWRRRKPKILLVSLSKRMGSKPSHVLGSLIVSRIAQAILDRETVPEELRQDFTLYIDEFQNFTSQAMADILDEARKYRLRLVLCHQRRNQIANQNLRDAVLGSASTLVVFRLSAKDAEELVPELGLRDSYGEDRPHLLTKLPNYRAYVKTMDGKYPTDAVRIETIPQALPTGSLKRVQTTTARRYTRYASNEHRGVKCGSQSRAGSEPKRRAS
jgi:hypothetical protein